MNTFFVRWRCPKCGLHGVGVWVGDEQAILPLRGDVCHAQHLPLRKLGRSEDEWDECLSILKSQVMALTRQLHERSTLLGQLDPEVA